jgi:hypothetical protein
MRRLTFGLASAFITFVIGISFSTFLFRHQTPQVKRLENYGARPAEDKIVEAVLRYQIQHYSAEVKQPTYFLSYGNDNDPSAEIMARLQEDYLHVNGLSQLSHNTNRYYYRGEDEQELIIRVGNIKWISPTEILVGGSYRSRGNIVDAYIYHVVLDNNQWIVKDSELIS